MTQSLRNYITTPTAMKTLRDALLQTLTFGRLKAILSPYVTDPNIADALSRLVGKKHDTPVGLNAANDMAAALLGFNNLHEANTEIGHMKSDVLLPFGLRPGGRLDLKKVVYLTSSCCENTEHVSQYYMQANGLYFQNTEENGFYPLSEKEERYIAEEQILLGNQDDSLLAFTGYTVLIDNRKYLALAHETHYERGHPELHDKDAAFDAHQANAARLGRMSIGLGGFIASSDTPEYDDPEEGLGHYLTLLCVPFDVAYGKASDFGEWELYLRMLDEYGDDTLSRALLARIHRGESDPVIWRNASANELAALIQTL